MVKEASDKFVVLMLIMAVVVSIAGSLIVMDNINKEEVIFKSEIQPSISSGLVTLEINDNLGDEISEKEK